MAFPISMNYGVNGFQQGGIAGSSATSATNTQQEITKFQDLIESLQAENKVKPEPSNQSAQEKQSHVQGFAANLGDSQGLSEKRTIDKTSKLYEKSLELESYFVKIMLSSMRNTISKTNLSGENNYAQSMYEDMLYDERSLAMTKNAGFGLADQIYLQLSV